MRRSSVAHPSMLLTVLAVSACGTAVRSSGDAGADLPPFVAGLRLNEVVASDDGTNIDEQGETEDWIELVNTSAETIDLSAYQVGDDNHVPRTLPAEHLGPGQTVLFWADEQPEQGTHHLRFKISSAGDHIVLRDLAGRMVDEIATPALGLNEAYGRFPNGTGAFSNCVYATPNRANGDRCGPPVPEGLPPNISFAPFTWPEDPAAPKPLAVTEIALYPGRFVEVQNTSAAPIELSDFVLFLQPFAPGDPLPDFFGGNVVIPAITWPVAMIAPGERIVVPLDATIQALLGTNPEREGIFTVQRRSDHAAIDRVDFMQWPDGAVLNRDTDLSGRLVDRFTFCANATPGTAVACQPLAARAVGDRLHNLRTAGDFAALADGGSELENRSVKFVVDMEAGDTVHFLGTRRWDLHYTFVRERIYHQPKLDRCVAAEAATFTAGWVDFSVREYFQTQRRFLLGTLVRWGGSGIATVEFAVGDLITAEQMRRIFFAVTRHMPDPRAWAVRPQAEDQVQRIGAVEGTLPIVDPNAPFRGQTFQALVATTGYGVLKFIAGAELPTAPLGPDVIVITDQVPNDIPLVGGLITEAFQTPLAHVAVLSKNRGVPNMALLGARGDSRLAPFLDKLVRLDVTGDGFTVSAAAPEEANAFWEKLRPKRPRLSPRLDTSVRGIVDLRDRSLDDLPSIGAKAAQIGELYRLAQLGVACTYGLPLPNNAFAIPVVHSREHFQTSGAAAVFAARSALPAFAADPRVRAMGLAEVRSAILNAPVEPGLLQMVSDEMRKRFGTAHVRLRSSSNTEDLPGFTGAGLYTSLSVALDDPERDVGLGLKTVWASLWQPRAYDERELGSVDHGGSAMGVLVQAAFTNERANGVAISRNVLDPIYGDASYFNAQAGEASVTNPAPGVISEQGTYQAGIPPRVIYTSRSSLIPGAVVTTGELEILNCALGAIHRHFQQRLDPMHLDRWFAMDIEWKLIGPERQLVIKQARPYSFGRADVPTDCREF